MKQRSILWQATGFAFVTFFGTILHFLYDWTGENIWISPFSGINESTWEHMKLLYWPLFLFALIQRLFFKKQQNFWFVKLAEILLGLALIPVLFYTYNGVIGKSPDWINISIFFVAAASAYLYENKLFAEDKESSANSRVSFAILCVIGALFILFTFVTPKIGIFMDPVTGKYGI